MATDLLAVCIGGLAACLAALVIGYRMERRYPPREPRLTTADLFPLCLCDRCLTDEDAALLAHVRGEA